MRIRFDPLPQDKLGEVAYKTIADALINGSLRAGDKLRIRDIAAQMGTSVTPVRDAILRLVQDNAVVLRNPRDIRVRSISLEEYLEIRTIRIELEGLAAARAAKLADSHDIERLEVLIRNNEKAIKRNDFSRGPEFNQTFHFELVKIAQTPVLLGILERLWMRIGPLIAEIYESGGLSMVKHHKPIVKALKEGNARSARAAIKKDIVSGGEIILKHLEKLDPSKLNEDVQ